MVENYVAGLDPDDEPVGVERTVATRTDRIAVSGRIDRLDERPSGEAGTELVVVDYKTGRHLLTTDDARSSLALALYAVAAARSLRRQCHRVELHHLPSGGVVTWEHTDATLARQVRRAEEIAAECAPADERFRAGMPPGRYDELFPPRPGPACGWCDYLRHCDVGAAAARPRRPWDTSPTRMSRDGHEGGDFRCRRSPASNAGLGLPVQSSFSSSTTQSIITASRQAVAARSSPIRNSFPMTPPNKRERRKSPSPSSSPPTLGSQ
jgi:hypothetical protein